MKAVQLFTSAAGTAGDKDSVEIGGDSPFEVGKPITILLFSTGSGTAPVYAIDGSDDDSTFEELGTSEVVGLSVITVPCRKFMRLSVTTAAGTAGTVSAVAVASL